MHGDLLRDLPETHDFCYKRSNCLPSCDNDMSNAPQIFHLAYKNILCPECLMNINLAIMQYNSIFTGQQQISEIAMFSPQDKRYRLLFACGIYPPWSKENCHIHRGYYWHIKFSKLSKSLLSLVYTV